MRNKKKNIYMGNNSVAKIPVFGNVDTDNEICLNAIATAYDALNNIMLTRNHGIFEKATSSEINGRFGILRMLCSKYAPRMHPVVDKLHKIVTENSKGRISDKDALVLMRGICTKHGINSDIFDVAIMRVDQAEQFKKQVRHPKLPHQREPDSLFFWSMPNKKRR